MNKHMKSMDQSLKAPGFFVVFFQLSLKYSYTKKHSV